MKFIYINIQCVCADFYQNMLANRGIFFLFFATLRMIRMNTNDFQKIFLTFYEIARKMYFVKKREKKQPFC